VLIDLLNPRPGERILDIGCGLGQQAAEMASRGAEVTGIDRSELLIEQARIAHPQVHFEVASLGHYKAAQPFDGLFTRGALHWIKPETAAARTLYGLLKPGGRLAAEIGAAGSGLSAHESETWVSALNEAGFHMISQTRLEDGRLRVSARKPDTNHT
jgi:trans-aconitate methyltransferase